MTFKIEQVPPASESLVIKVTAFQFNFRFEYPNGVQTVGECRIPAGKAVVFNVTSIDVYHNFGLPDFKMKIDAIPGRYNTLWIVAPPLDGATERRYTIRCYEMCGMGHTEMVATLIAMDPASLQPVAQSDPRKLVRLQEFWFQEVAYNNQSQRHWNTLHSHVFVFPSLDRNNRDAPEVSDDLHGRNLSHVQQVTNRVSHCLVCLESYGSAHLWVLDLPITLCRYR